MIRMTEDRYCGLNDEMIGLCRSCGEERECTEPDAEDYPCEACGKLDVYGAEQLLIMGQIEFTEVSS